MSGVQEVQETTAGDLGGLLDAGDGATVTLVAGDTQLVAHKAVLAARSPVFAAKFARGHQDNRVHTEIVDVEGQVLRQLLSFIYTYQAPQLSSMAPQLLAAASKYDVAALKAQCEQQVLRDLSVENAAAAAVLAVQHSCPRLKESAVALIRAHNFQVMATKGWADAVLNHPEEVVEVSRLLAAPLAEINTPACLDSKPSTSTQSQREHTWTADASTPTSSLHRLWILPSDATTSCSCMSEEEKGRKLIQAAQDGEVKDLQALLAMGADVAVLDWLDNTALHRAAYRGHVAAVSCLLQAGAEVDARGDGQLTPLLWAAQSGHTSVVRQLVAAAADPNARDECGRTPLHLAAMCGHAEVATALLEAGADRSIIDNRGRTPLAAARENNKKQLVDILSAPTPSGCRMKSGTQPQTDHGQTAVTAALLTVPRQFLQSLPPDATSIRFRSMSQAEKRRRLLQAVEDGAVDVLRGLLAEEADLGAWVVFGMTTLHIAAGRGYVEAVSYLLEAGAEVDARDWLQRTPLQRATWAGHTAVVWLLVAASADLSVRDVEGRTPLHWAALRGHSEVATVLLDAGADRSVTDNKGRTPLDLAMWSNKQQLVDILR